MSRMLRDFLRLPNLWNCSNGQIRHQSLSSPGGGVAAKSIEFHSTLFNNSFTASFFLSVSGTEKSPQKLINKIMQIGCQEFRSSSKKKKAAVKISRGLMDGQFLPEYKVKMRKRQHGDSKEC